METFEHRHSTVLFVAQHGPNDGKPLFGFVNTKTTWAEWEAKLHYRVAQFAAIDQGCAPEPIACCDLEDLPEFIKQGLALNVSPEKIAPLAFEVTPHHYEQARRLADTMPDKHPDTVGPIDALAATDEAQESTVTQFTVRTHTYSSDTYCVVTASHLPDALRRAADLIDGLTNPHAATVLLATEPIIDEEGKPMYGVRIEYEPSE